MTDAKAIGSRGAALALVVTGVSIVLLSYGEWGHCPTTPCGGALMAISEYYGFELGFGVVTAFAAIALTAIGLRGLWRTDVAQFATVAAGLALVIVVTACAALIWMFFPDFYWPPHVPILVAILGLIAFAASRRLGGTSLRDQ
jgi:hypothetical protein